MTARRGWAGRLGGGRTASATQPPPSRPEPGPARPFHSGPPERQPPPPPGPRADAAEQEPSGSALQVVLVSRDNMLAGALRSLIEAPGAIRMLDWHSDELDGAVRHADVVVVDMPPNLHERTFAVIDRRFGGRTVVLLQEGEHAEALPPGPPRVVLYRPLQIGELWAAVTGHLPTRESAASPEPVAAEPEVAAASDLEGPRPPEASPQPEIAGSPEVEVTPAPAAPEVAAEPGSADRPAPDPGVAPEPVDADQPASERVPAGEGEPEAGIAAAVEAEPGSGAGLAAAASEEAVGQEGEPPPGVGEFAEGLPVAESGRLIGLSGRELEPVIGPGQVAPGMDEATLERLRRWRNRSWQPTAGRSSKAPPKRRAAARENARQARAARAEARQAARTAAAQARAAQAEEQKAAREDAARARAARAEQRKAARAAAAQARAVRAGERKAARAEARAARATSREEARQGREARAEARRTARTEVRSARAARAETRRAERSQAWATRAEARKAARAEAAQARATRREARQAARAEAAQARAARREVRQAERAEAARERAARSAAQQAERAARNEVRRAERAEAARARAARAAAQRAQRAEAAKERAAARQVARAEAAEARAVRAGQRKAARAESKAARVARAEARKVARAEAARARAGRRAARAVARAESREAMAARRAARAEARQAARQTSRQAQETRAEERRTARAEQSVARSAQRAETQQARAAAAEARRAQRAEAQAVRSARRGEAKAARSAQRAEARQVRAARVGELRRVAVARVAAGRAAAGRVAAGQVAGRGARVGGLVRAGVVVGLMAAVGFAATGWRAEGGPDTLAGEVAAVRAAGGDQGGLVVEEPRVGPVEPLYALGVGAWLRASEDSSSSGAGGRVAGSGAALEATVQAARGPGRFLLAAAVALVVVLSLLLMRVGPGSGAAAGPGPTPPHGQPSAGARLDGAWRLVVAGLAAALVALDPSLLRAGRTVSGSLLAVVLALGTLVLAWAVSSRPALWWVPVVAVGTGLALLVSPLALPVVAVPAVAALLQGRRRELRRALGALALGGGLWLLLPLWVAGQNLAAGQAGWLLGRPPGQGSLAGSLAAAPLSWVLVAAGLVAAILTWRHRSGARSDAGGQAAAPRPGTATGPGTAGRGAPHPRRGSDPAPARVLALVSTTAVGALAAVALGYPVERALAFAVPAAAVAVAVVAGRTAAAVGGSARARRAVLAGVGVALSGLVVAQGLDARSRYGGRPDDGLGRLVASVAAQVPACAAVNAGGPDDRARLLAAGVAVTDLSTAPAAQAAGVRYFVLAGDQAGQGRPGDAALDAWVRDHGRRLAEHPSPSYARLELWRVDAGAGTTILPVPGGVFANVAGPACGGFRVVDDETGAFHTAYEALGGRAVLGGPLGAVWTSDGPALQAFDTMVLGAVPATGGLPGVRPIELPPLLAKLNAEALADADIPLPSLRPPTTDRQTQALLSDRVIARAYLGTDPATATDEDWRRARDRFGRPLGRPQVMPDGAVRQPFELVVLELPADGSPARPAALGRLAVRLGLVPERATALEQPPRGAAALTETRLDTGPLLWPLAGLVLLLALAAGASAVATRRRPGRAAGRDGRALDGH